MRPTALISLRKICLAVSVLFLSCGTDFLFEELEPPHDILIPAPTGLTASVGKLMARVRLSWQPASAAASYQVFKSNLPEGSAFSLVASNLSTTSWDDTNTAANVFFYYKIAYLTAASNRSELSGSVRGLALPWQAPAPVNLRTAEGSTPERVRITFSAGSNTSAVSWIIYTAGGPNEPFSELVVTNSTTLETSPLKPGRTHYFRVVGRDAGGIASQVSETASWSIPPAIALARPTALSASTGSDPDGVALSWSAVSGASGYRIYRAVQEGAGYSLLAEVASPPWKDSTAIAAYKYLYRVSATNSSEESLAHAAVEGWRGYGPWAGASIVMASDGSSSTGVVLSWLPVPGATHYTVFRGPSSSGPWAQIAGPLSETVWVDTTAAAGIRYWYHIVSLREDGVPGPPSPADEGFRAFEDAPPAPSGVEGIFNLVLKHKVTWNAVPGAVKYRVYFADHYHGPYTFTAEVSGTIYKASSLIRDNYYRISAVSSSGHEGAWSLPVQSAPNSGVCSPDNLTATLNSERGRVKLGWSPARGASKVWLERAPSPEGPWNRIGGDLESGSTGYLDLLTSGPWFYRVQAVNTLYTGGWSQTVMGSPLPYPPLSPPQNILSVNQAAGTEIVLTWDEVNQAAGYRVYRSREEEGLYVDVSGPLTATSWTNTGITAGTIWYYKIASLNAANLDGPLSSAVNNHNSLPAPAAVMASDGTLINKVAVLWTSVPSADHYRVYRAGAQDGVSLCISPRIPASQTQFMDETPLPGSGWYRVVAFDAAGTPGIASVADSGTPKAIPLPNPPGGLIASDGSSTNGIILSWQPSPAAAYYRVARANRIDGDYVFISPPLTNCEYLDSSVPAREFFYKVAACNSAGLSGLLSSADRGYKGLTDLDFLIAFDTTIASSHKKLTLMHNSGTGALGKEIKNGTLQGQVLYDASMSGLGARIVFNYVSYRDHYLVLDGSYTVQARMDKSGTMDGTITVSSPVYNGTVRYALIISGGKASGGFWHVRQAGSPTETKIPWFPSPSSLLD